MLSTAVLKSPLLLAFYHCLLHGQRSCECLLLDKPIRVRPLKVSSQEILCSLSVAVVALLAPVPVLFQWEALGLSSCCELHRSMGPASPQRSF